MIPNTFQLALVRSYPERGCVKLPKKLAEKIFIGRNNHLQSLTKSAHPRDENAFIESYRVQKGFLNIRIRRIGFGLVQIK